MTAPLAAVFCMPEVSHPRRRLAMVAALAGRGVAVSVYTGTRVRAPVAWMGGRFVDL